VRLIDSATAAVALGLTDRRVRQLVNEGALTNLGTSRKIRLDVEQVADLHARRAGHDVAH
jgi:hypothetical protein